MRKTKKTPQEDRPEPPAEETRTDGLVPMFRSAAAAAGGPTEADVHSSAVAEWQAAGWEIKKGD